MSPSDAAREIAEFLEAEGVPYAIMGGVAVQFWGESRYTRDLDVVITVEGARTRTVIEAALQRFRPRLTNAGDMALQNRVLLLATDDGTPIDMTFGIPGYEVVAISRARTVRMAGKDIRVLASEDLVIHKCLAGRARDVEDVEGILVRMKDRIDLDYIRTWLTEFAEVVEGRDLLMEFEEAVRDADRKTTDIG